MQFVTESFIALRFGKGLRQRDIYQFISEIEQLSEYFELKVSPTEIFSGISFRYIENAPNKNKKLNTLFNDERFVFLMKFSGNTKAFHGMHTLIKYHIEKRIRDLINALAIAKNGAIDCAGAQIYFDKKLMLEMPMLIHSIDLAIEQSRKIKWPLVRRMPLKPVWVWYSNFSEETDGLSETRIGRALNAYSQLFSTSGGLDDQAALFWALLGIEAIYAEGKDNIQQQVNEHTELFLGARKEFKKAFKELYDYRSRFVHGDLNINNQFELKNGTPEFMAGLYKMYDNTGLAICILLATFQKLVRSNKQEIQFRKLTKTVIE